VGSTDQILDSPITKDGPRRLKPLGYLPLCPSGSEGREALLLETPPALCSKASPPPRTRVFPPSQSLPARAWPVTILTEAGARNQKVPCRTTSNESICVCNEAEEILRIAPAPSGCSCWVLVTTSSRGSECVLILFASYCSLPSRLVSAQDLRFNCRGKFRMRVQPPRSRCVT